MIYFSWKLTDPRDRINVSAKHNGSCFESHLTSHPLFGRRSFWLDKWSWANLCSANQNKRGRNKTSQLNSENHQLTKPFPRALHLESSQLASVGFLGSLHWYSTRIYNQMSPSTWLLLGSSLGLSMCHFKCKFCVSFSHDPFVSLKTDFLCYFFSFITGMWPDSKLAKSFIFPQTNDYGVDNYSLGMYFKCLEGVSEAGPQLVIQIVTMFQGLSPSELQSRSWIWSVHKLVFTHKN